MTERQDNWHLDNVRIVLVGCTHPGNIGACARAMKTMGLSRLILVSPERFPHDEATARAAGATDLLASATVCESLDAALAGCRLVIGASARRRSLSVPLLEPRACAHQALQAAADGPVALVFGREHSGLTNAELTRCHHLVQIPANPDYASLNLAAAVQVLAYELRLAACAGAAQDGAEPDAAVPVPAEDMERFYAHLQLTLEQIGFLDAENPRIMMPRLRRLFNRARPDQVEMNLLRGLLHAVQKRTKH